MAIIIPSSAIEQTDRSANLDSSDRRGFSRVFKGTSYSALYTATKSMQKGDTYDSEAAGDKLLVLESFNLQRIPGGGGKLTLNFVPNDTVVSGQTETTTCLEETWSLKAIRNDQSVLGYCGTTAASNPSRAFIECWQKETDAAVADNNAYIDPSGAQQNADPPTSDVINKLKAGKDSVIRFYPSLTRRRTYSTFPDGCLENLAHIDSPPVPADSTTTPTSTSTTKIKKPKGLAAKVALYQWLKVQDDADEQSNGDWVRVETWWGIKIGEGAWDPNFYGDSGAGGTRWSVPYQVENSSQNPN